MEPQRPINLNLITMRFPIPAIASILHRISGVLLFLFLPFVLYMFEHSLFSEATFELVKQQLSLPLVRFFTWGMFTLFIYHLLAGIRHLFMDAGVGESLKGGRLGAQLVFGATVLLSILAGIRLW